MKRFGLVGYLLLFSSLFIGCQQTTPPLPVSSGLSNFRYRVPIKVDEKSGTTLKDYQIRIAIQGVDPNQPWCVDFSRIQANGRDIRLVNEKQELLDFWIQAWDNEAKTAVVWIKIPQIKASTSTSIYLYYGNAEAKPLSSLDRTMQKLQVDETTAGLWHFDGRGEKVLDSSPHKNHASFRPEGLNTRRAFFRARWVGSDGGTIGSLPHHRFSYGNALSFNGQDEYIEIPYHNSLDFTGTESISLEAWIYPVRDSRKKVSGKVSNGVCPLTPTQYTALLVKRGMYALYLHVSPSDSVSGGNGAGKISCFLWGPKPMVYHTSKSILPFKKWSHIAVTYDGRRVSFYLNGEYDNEIPVSGLIQPVLDRIHPEGLQARKSSLYIGNDPNPEYPRLFQGAIDEVRLLRRVLSEEEVKADYERRAYLPAEASAQAGAPVEPELSLGEEEKVSD